MKEAPERSCCWIPVKGKRAAIAGEIESIMRLSGSSSIIHRSNVCAIDIRPVSTTNSKLTVDNSAKQIPFGHRHIVCCGVSALRDQTHHYVTKRCESGTETIDISLTNLVEYPLIELQTPIIHTDTLVNRLATREWLA